MKLNEKQAKQSAGMFSFDKRTEAKRVQANKSAIAHLPLCSLSHFIPPLNKQAIAATQAEIEVPFLNIPAHRLIFIFISSLCVPDSRQTSRCRTFALPCRQNICGGDGLVFAKFECTAC
jgi:hypothetical protein